MPILGNPNGIGCSECGVGVGVVFLLVIGGADPVFGFVVCRFDPGFMKAPTAKPLISPAKAKRIMEKMAIVRECELKLFVCRRSDSVCMLYDCSLLVCKKGNITGQTRPDFQARDLAPYPPDFPLP
jgi:hypothetical protein